MQIDGEVGLFQRLPPALLDHTIIATKSFALLDN